jgi:hypothetical protein
MELGLAGNGPPEQDEFYTVSTDIGREHFVMAPGLWFTLAATFGV